MATDKSSENEEFELDDDALALAAGGVDSLAISDPENWNFRAVVHGPDGATDLKHPRNISDFSPTGGDNFIYTIPAVSLVSNFSVHHLDNVQQTGGIYLSGQNRIQDGNSF